MARVVQRRKSPPYALIIFVFLFLTASVLFVMQYNEADELRNKLGERSVTLAKLASTEERDGPKVTGMMREFDQTRTDTGVGSSVVNQFEKQVNELTQVITGTPGESSDSVDKVAKLRTQTGSSQGLIHEVLDLHKKLGNAQSQIEDLHRQRKRHEEELATRDRNAKKMQADFDAQVSSQNQQIAELKRKGQTREGEHQNLLDGAKKEWAQIREGLNKKIAALVQDVERGKRDVKHWQTLYKALEQKFEQYRPKFVPNLARKPDGQIIKLVEEANLCYIDLGQNKRIVPGLTFSVYPATGIPEDGVGKAKIVVTNVSDTVSECRILEQDRQHPVLLNDLIANLVYDPVRRYRFVVEGEFDMHGRGRPSMDGTKQVRLMIQQFGGKLGKEVAVDSDFVIMGEPPMRPAKPKEDAPPAVHRVYEEQMKIFDRYHTVQRLAQSLRVPLLNTNRFIAFMGYVPVEEAQ